MNQIVVEARQRVFLLSEDDAKDPVAETALGRLYLTRAGPVGTDGKRARLISASQLDAGKRLHEIHMRAMRALQAPVGLAKHDGKAGWEWELDADPEKDQRQGDYAEWATRAVGLWEVAQDWLKQAGDYETVEALRVCIDDQPPKDIATLVRALTYLAKRMGFADRDEVRLTPDKKPAKAEI